MGATMPITSTLIEQMELRTARFSELQASPQAFVDTRIPEHVRDIYNVIGRGVTEDPMLEPAVTAVEGFNVTYIGAEPGKGAALHSHLTVEVFVALTGHWIVYWGDEGDGETELAPMDLVSVPVGVMRGFRNISNEHAYLMAILGGDDAGRVDWAQSVLSRARDTGLQLDAEGNLLP